MVPVNIDIEHQSPLTYGTMAVDLNHVTGKACQCLFCCTAVDVEEVWNLIDHKLRRKRLTKTSIPPTDETSRKFHAS